MHLRSSALLCPQLTRNLDAQTNNGAEIGTPAKDYSLLNMFFHRFLTG